MGHRRRVVVPRQDEGRVGQRKDDVAQEYLAKFEDEEGVLFIGKAQEKASVFRTEKRRDAAGLMYPWIIRSTAMVKSTSYVGRGTPWARTANPPITAYSIDS